MWLIHISGEMRSSCKAQKVKKLTRLKIEVFKIPCIEGLHGFSRTSEVMYDSPSNSSKKGSNPFHVRRQLSLLQRHWVHVRHPGCHPSRRSSSVKAIALGESPHAVYIITADWTSLASQLRIWDMLLSANHPYIQTQAFFFCR